MSNHDYNEFERTQIRIKDMIGLQLVMTESPYCILGFLLLDKTYVIRFSEYYDYDDNLN